MTDPQQPVREVMSRGAISVDEKLTLRSLAAVLAELDAAKPGHQVLTMREFPPLIARLESAR